MRRQPSAIQRLAVIAAALALALSALMVVNASAANAAGAKKSAKPRVVGSPAAGRVLTCKSKGKAKRYRWMRGNKVVKTSKRAKYKVRKADAGKRLRCAVKAKRGSFKASAAVTVARSATNLNRPSITGHAAPGNTLHCDPGTWDGSETFHFYWKRDGSPAGTTSTYQVTSADLGRKLVCSVSAWNASGGTGRVDSDPVEVTSAGGVTPPTSAPLNTVAPSISGIPNPGWTLTCDPGTWTGITEPDTAYTYLWQRNGSPVGTDPSYLLTDADVDTTVICQVAASNSAGGSGMVPSNAVNVFRPPAPAATVPPELTGPAEYGERQYCSIGTWAHHPLSYTLEWVRNGTVVRVATFDATDPSVVLSDSRLVTYADIGRELLCRVTATNSGGAGAADSNTSIAYPVNVTRPSISGTAVVDETLTCDPGTWTVAPAHVVTYDYTWQRNGSDIAGAMSADYVVTWDDADTDLTCSATVTRLLATGAPATSDPVRALPKAPAATAAPSISPVPTEAGEPMTCDIGTWINRPTQFTVRFYRGALEIGPATTTFPAGAQTTVTRNTALNDVGKDITCEVTASNTGGSTASTSAPVSPIPSNTALPSVSPAGTVPVGQLLTCDPGSWNKAGTYTYTWERNGSAIAGADASTYTTTGADSGTAVGCTVVLTHSGASSDPAASSTVAVS